MFGSAIMKSCFLLSIVTLAGLACRFFPVAAQCPGTTDLNISATLYTQENGLSSDLLTRMAKDSVGYRYFLGTDLKWIRYDGMDFTSSYRENEAYNKRTEYWKDFPCITQYDGSILYKFIAGKSHSLGWTVIGDSLICVDNRTQKKQAYRLPANLVLQGALLSPDAEDMCWLTTTTTVYRFHLSTKKFVQIPLPPEKPALLVNNAPLQIFFRSDGVPFMPYYKGVLQLDRHVPTAKKWCSLLPGQFYGYASPLLINNHVYAGYNGTVFNDLDLNTGVVSAFRFTPPVGTPNTPATGITTLANYEGQLLIGTTNAGLFLFNTCNHSIQRINYEQKISATNLTSAVTWITVDDENVIWVQTEGGLIKMELNKQKISTYRPSSVQAPGVGNFSDNIRAIYPDNGGHLVIGSLQGSYLFDLATSKMQPLIAPSGRSTGNERDAVGSITSDGKGTLFLGSYGYHGILLYQSGSKKQTSILDINQQPDFFCHIANCLLYDSHHTLWVGSNSGILRIKQIDKFIAGGFKGKPTVATGFPQNGTRRALQPQAPCSAIAEDSQGNIWVGSWDGLYVYNRASGTVVKYTHNPANPQSISNNEVRSICLSKTGGVWIGTLHGGLNYFDPKTGVFTAYTTDNGLPNNSIYTILEDDKGFLWLGTNAGLCRFSKNDHTVRNYTPRDGTQNYEFNTNAACKAPNGLLCFGGRTGFNIFHPDSLTNGVVPPKPVITRFTIFDKEYPVPDSTLVLSHGQNSFSFEFASLSYYRSSDHQFAYLLEGADKDWIKSGNRHYTSYAHLPPGQYTFKVRVANYTGVWSKEITTLKIIITPAWYNTWWARLSIALLLAAGVYGLYNYRIRQIQKLYTVRNRIASDLHDEIGSTLSSISISSTMIQRKLQASDATVNNLLLQVSNNTSHMLDALSDIVWAINSGNDRFDNVVNRIRAFAIEVLEPAGICIHFQVDDGVPDLKLDMQQRKDLYLILKEAIHNIIKYAACENVTIHIGRKGVKTLVLEIKDDGKGFDTDNLNTQSKSLSGNGIRNMHKRAADLGGNLHIVSTPQKGTFVSLVFNL